MKPYQYHTHRWVLAALAALLAAALACGPATAPAGSASTPAGEEVMQAGSAGSGSSGDSGLAGAAGAAGSSTATPEGSVGVIPPDEGSGVGDPTDTPAPTTTFTLAPTDTPVPPPTSTPVPPPTNTPVPPPTSTPVPPPTNTPVPPPPPTEPPSGPQCWDDSGAMLERVNADRAAAGLSALSVDGRLNAAAQRHAVDMVNNNFFSHTGSDGSTVATRATDAGYSWQMIGENIAAGSPDVDGTYSQWWNSAGHRDNMMNPDFQHMGLAHCYSPSTTYGHYWVQVFGRPW
jgi:uncharacterized protein YkwD